MVARPEETPEELALRALTVLQATIDRQKLQLAAAQPKADALDRIEGGEGSMCITAAAKVLKVGPKTLADFMQQRSWTYRRPGGRAVLGYQAEDRDRDARAPCHNDPAWRRDRKSRRAGPGDTERAEPACSALRVIGRRGHGMSVTGWLGICSAAFAVGALIGNSRRNARECRELEWERLQITRAADFPAGRPRLHRTTAQSPKPPAAPPPPPVHQRGSPTGLKWWQ